MRKSSVEAPSLFPPRGGSTREAGDGGARPKQPQGNRSHASRAVRLATAVSRAHPHPAGVLATLPHWEGNWTSGGIPC